MVSKYFCLVLSRIQRVHSWPINVGVQTWSETLRLTQETERILEAKQELHVVASLTFYSRGQVTMGDRD